MKYSYKIHRLSSKFYQAYPKNNYPEILQKQDRPYTCIVFQVMENLLVSIPYRTNIQHSYSYRFRLSKRSIENKSGLDYTKMVVIRDEKYLEARPAIIDSDEYKETIINIERIQKEALEFLQAYVDFIRGGSKLHQKEISRRYKFSPLKYFHDELNI